MTTPRTSPRPRHAFTLLEVMIAVVAMAIVLSAISAVFYGALRLRNRTVQDIESALPLQRALRVIKRDLANIVTPGGSLSGTLQTTTTSGSTNSSPTQLPADMPRSAVVVSPQFCTATATLGDLSPWSEVQKVTYLLAEPTNRVAGLDLYRSVSRNLLPPNVDEPVAQWLMGGVENVLFTYYDGAQWIDTWDSTTTSNSIPKAIKVEITLAASITNRFAPPPIELVVPLVMDSLTNATSTAQAAGPGAAGPPAGASGGQQTGGTQPPANNPPTGGSRG